MYYISFDWPHYKINVLIYNYSLILNKKLIHKHSNVLNNVYNLY